MYNVLMVFKDNPYGPRKNRQETIREDDVQ